MWSNKGSNLLTPNTDMVLYDVKDVQRIFKIGQNAAYALMRSDGFPAIRLNRKLLVEQNALRNWLKQQERRTVIL